MEPTVGNQGVRYNPTLNRDCTHVHPTLLHKNKNFAYLLGVAGNLP